MKHTLRLHNEPFLLIELGQKTVEARLYDEKRRSIQAGDEIEFINRSNGRRLLVKVSAIHVYPDFRTMFEELGVQMFGGTEFESTLNAMQKYYSIHEQHDSGVVGIAITPLK